MHDPFPSHFVSWHFHMFYYLGAPLGSWYIPHLMIRVRRWPSNNQWPVFSLGLLIYLNPPVMNELLHLRRCIHHTHAFIRYFIQSCLFIQMNTLGLTDNFDEDPNKFAVWTKSPDGGSEIYVMVARSQSIKKTWVEAIRSILENQLNFAKGKGPYLFLLYTNFQIISETSMIYGSKRCILQVK